MAMNRKGLGQGKGMGYKNLVSHDKVVHSMNAKGIKSKMSTMTPVPKYSSMQLSEMPYADDVRFYANSPKANIRTIIWSKSDYLGKGWYQYEVNGYKWKSRDESAISDYVRNNYPDYKRVSLFSETSYKTLDDQDKITNYGTNDWSLQFSKYKPIAKYQLGKPIKSNQKSKFGKPLKEIEMKEWTYVVIDWKPVGDKTELQVNATVSDGFGNEKQLYSGKVYDIKDKDKAIAEFKKVVADIDNL